MTVRRSTTKNEHSVIGPMDSEFQESLLRAINEASPDGILVVDERDVVVSHNHRFFEMWRIPGDYLKNTDGGNGSVGAPDHPILAFVVQSVKDPQSFLKRVKELYNDPMLDDHCEIELKDGRTVERYSTVLRGPCGRYLGRVWFFRDVSERKRTEAVLRDLAEHDPLTGAANRRYFLLRFFQEFVRARRYCNSLSLIMIDIDHFKLINDKYGHAAGDEVLKALCSTCGHILREVDLLGRLGGEEFTVLLPNTALEGAHATADRLRELVAAQVVLVNAHEIRCTISAGTSTMDSADPTIDAMLKRADNAMYRAKERGRNRVEDATALLLPGP
jgi:diguanylate cyclase (GGDEF)-like protein